MPHIITPKILDRKEHAEDMVCKVYNLHRSVITAPVRNKMSTQARFAVWGILYFVEGFSSPLIGQLYGKDHATILYGVRMASANGLLKDMGIEYGTNSGKGVHKSGTAGGKNGDRG